MAAKKYKKVAFDSKLLKKKPFLRAINTNIFATQARHVSVGDYVSAEIPNLRFEVVTQNQFLQELDPRSHAINDTVLYPNKRVKETREINGEKVEYYRESEIARISVPFQSMIASRQCVHLFGKPLKLTTKKDANNEQFARFKEYCLEKNIYPAIYLMAKSALTTGDGAIYFFMNDDGLQYKIWSYADGDQLIPVYKKNGIDLDKFIRRYWSTPDGFDNPVDTIDIFTETTYQQLFLDGNDWKELTPTKTHGFMQIPVAYHAERDVAWGVGQELIETIELFMSNVREAAAYFDFGILFLKGDDVEVLPTKETQGKVIISTDPQGDAKMLEKTDMSQSLKFEFEQYTKQLFRSTGTVIIDPEILKGGDQSGAYIKNLYNDAVQYAMDRKPLWQPVLEKIMKIVKEALGLEERAVLEYKNLPVICEPDIYVPMNLAEEVTLINQSVTMKSLSTETASQIHPFASPNEYERMEKERKESNETQQIQQTV